ncbi:hypothetical protein TNCT_559481 [Trichonephila clavata]|uniref:Uncharacterized protein n=1 Tax=Trichonephila clavata TaxID=2740835 RepID=A0A8X6JZ50_TRICU|nr:hypothetical protein TNCT_559481 [Trichonephila clavata]
MSLYSTSTLADLCVWRLSNSSSTNRRSLSFKNPHGLLLLAVSTPPDLVRYGLVIPVADCLSLMHNLLRREYGLVLLHSSCLFLICRPLRT